MNSLKNTKVLIGIIIILVVINIGTLSFLWFTWPSEKTKRSDRERIPQVERFLQKKLNLNKDQTRLFQKARNDHFTATQDLLKTMRKDRKELMKLLSQDNSAAEVEQLIKKISESQLDLERASFGHMQRLRSFCREEQQPKFDSILFNMVDRLGHNRGEMRKRHRRNH